MARRWSFTYWRLLQDKSKDHQSHIQGFKQERCVTVCISKLIVSDAYHRMYSHITCLKF
ncbi:homocysteine S-methyltransferase 2-like [Iris pallida]|uniref:Homocysteine S-methyltransferase 2-like n=1 Tax=Iris pallida TaxID=29817 RepID=A0AAX6FKX4_IRIPA|nr:homocysteine S-methyltransferase 2-like [Iris pallida]